MNRMPQKALLRPLLARLGAIGWIFGTLQFFLCHLIVQAAWPVAYSWANNTISDLGNIHCQPWGDNARYVCSPLHIVMDTSVVIEGLLILMGAITITSLWRQTFLSRAAQNLLILNGLGIILAGLVPADVNENLHVLGALFITICGNLGLLLTGFVSPVNHMRGIRTPAIGIGFIGLLATILFFSGQYLGLGMGGMERFAVFTVLIWTFIAGCFFLISSARDSRRTGLESSVGTHDN